MSFLPAAATRAGIHLLGFAARHPTDTFQRSEATATPQLGDVLVECLRSLPLLNKFEHEQDYHEGDPEELSDHDKQRIIALMQQRGGEATFRCGLQLPF